MQIVNVAPEKRKMIANNPKNNWLSRFGPEFYHGPRTITALTQNDTRKARKR